MKGVDKKIIGIFILLILFSVVLGITLLKKPIVMDSKAEEIEVTIYNSDLGVVKEYRTQFLSKGLNNVLYKGVAARIDPTSVRLRAVDGTVDILEQNFQYDLVNKNKILEKYIDKEITAYLVYGDKKEVIEGTLMSFSGSNMIIRDKNNEIQILSTNNLLLPELPEGLITKPTLEWILNSGETKNQTLELSYMTSGMTWRADYVAVTNKDDDKLDLNGWVTITNNAGTTFKDASLKLVAGDVNRAQVGGGRLDRPMGYAETRAFPTMKQFTEESLFEYHMYDLQRKTTLKNNEQKQISLLRADNINVEKEYVYDDIKYWWWYGSDWSDTSEKKVNVMLNFENSEENNLGIPLPKGIVRVFKEDSEGKLQFIGEDSIDHTPKDETIRLFIGKAFDIVGERKQMDFNIMPDWFEYEWEVTLRNHKNDNIIVSVLERTGGDWEIIKENIPHIKESNNRIKWRVPVNANGDAKLRYTIRYKMKYKR